VRCQVSATAAGEHPGDPATQVESPPGTQEKILAAAAKVIAEQGLAGVRMAGIAKAAGVSTGLLHYHFDTKERLFAEVLVWSNKRSSVLDQEAIRVAGQRPPERLAAYLDRCLPSDEQLAQDWLLWQELASLCLRQPELGQVGVDLYDHLYDTVAAIIDDGRESGDFRPPIEGSRIVAEAAIAMCDGLGTRVLSAGPDLTLAGARHILAETMGVLLGHDGPLPIEGAEAPVAQAAR
jgi:AcrR family transcriptional regulator